MSERGPGEPPEELELTAAEWGLWQAYRNGSTFDLRSGVEEADAVERGHAWGGERTLRAQVIAYLLLDGPPPLSGRAAALKVWGGRITGVLDLSNSGITVPFELRDCHLELPLRLVDCQAGTLILDGCRMPRLEATRLVTGGDLSLKGCVVPDGLALAQAQIGMDLTLDRLRLGGSGSRDGRALDADGMNVRQDVNADLLDAVGELTLRGARVGGTMSLRGCALRNPRGAVVLNASRMAVEEDLVFAPCFFGPESPLGTEDPESRSVRMKRPTVRGGVRLDGSTFGGALVLDGLRLGLDHDQELSLRGIQAVELRFLVERPEQGKVVLANAVVRRLRDRATSWPGPGMLDLGGFTYETLVPYGVFPLSQRLEWLAAASPEYAPEPYDRLAASLSAAGEGPAGDEVLLAKMRRRRETLPLSLKVWDHIQDIALGYGYRPGRAAIWLSTLWAWGSVWFAWKPPPPLNPDEAPHWQPVIYALDLLLPILNLGQEAAWRTSGASQWIALALVVLGWLLATIVTAGAAAVIFRRN